HRPKLMFICSPNNPTGNKINKESLRELVGRFPGIVAVDEAYGEFSNHNLADLVEEFPNLIILRTFSKALGLAGLRIGYCIASKEVAKQINRVKPPYNINSFSQRAAILTLENIELIQERTKE